MDVSTVPLPRPPREALIGVGTLGVVCLGLGTLYLTTGLGVPCPLHRLTGWWCPFCGGTRMAAALMKGNIAQAWNDNMVLMVVGFAIGVRTIGWIVELIRHPDRGTRWVPWAISRHWVAIFIVVSVVWTVVRNLA